VSPFLYAYPGAVYQGSECKCLQLDLGSYIVLPLQWRLVNVETSSGQKTITIGLIQGKGKVHPRTGYKDSRGGGGTNIALVLNP
jgi:hypothetical protein